MQLDVGDIRALARVRLYEGTKMHLALEQGEYCPWVGEPLELRRFGDARELGCLARIVHTGGVTVTLELLPGRARVETIPFERP
ncbi:MAG TPA: hypothetical protein VIF62_07360 [Labilithrix sp.]